MAELLRRVPVMVPPFSLSDRSGRGREGAISGGGHIEEIRFDAAIKASLLEREKKKKLCDAVNFPHSACLLLHPS